MKRRDHALECEPATPRLAVGVRPIHGEAAQRYLLRVTQANGYLNATWLGAGGAPLRSDPRTPRRRSSTFATCRCPAGSRKGNIDRLGVLMNADRSPNGHTIFRYVSGVSWPSRVSDCKRLGVCPVCIAGSLVIATAGDCLLMLMPHGWFADAPAVTAPQETIELIGVLALSVNSAAPEPRSELVLLIGHLDFGQPHEIISSLDIKFYRKCPNEGSVTPAGTAQAVTFAAKTLCSWPQGFYKLVDASQTPTTRGKSVSFSDEFGALAKVFFRPLGDQAFDFAKTTFLGHVTVAYPDFTNKIAKRISIEHAEGLNFHADLYEANIIKPKTTRPGHFHHIRDATHHTNPRTLIAKLRVASATPLIEPDSRSGISAVWRMSDVAVLLPLRDRNAEGTESFAQRPNILDYEE